MLWLAARDSRQLVQTPVAAVEDVQAEGKFNPYTDEGPSGCRFFMAGRARAGMIMRCAAARRGRYVARMS